MKSARWIFWAWAAGIFSLVPFAFAQEGGKMVAEGDKFYRAQEYSQALEKYEEALKAHPESPALAFNVAAGQYKTEDFSGAGDSFEKALSTPDKRQEAWANYNLGNSRYQAGVAARESEPQKAISLWEGALEDYKRAMAIAPKDEDIKFNYEVVARDLKLLKEKLQSQPQSSSSQQKEQQQQPQQQKGEDRSREEQQQESSSEEQERQQKQQEQQQKEQAQQEEGQGQEPKPQPSPSDEKKQGEGGGSEGDPREMSPREAQMLLDDFRREEMPLGEINDKREAREGSVLKDW